jgi:hypothetical protein
MRHLHLILFRDADLARLIGELSQSFDLLVSREGLCEREWFSLHSADGALSISIQRRSDGWGVSVGLPRGEEAALHVARSHRVRSARLFLSGDEARSAAVHSWWGPDVHQPLCLAERTDERLGLQVRASYQESRLDESPEDAAAWSAEPTAALCTLSAEVTPLPSPQGLSIPAATLAAFLAQTSRAIDCGQHDLVRTILETPSSASPPA